MVYLLGIEYQVNEVVHVITPGIGNMIKTIRYVMLDLVNVCPHTQTGKQLFIIRFSFVYFLYVL